MKIMINYNEETFMVCWLKCFCLYLVFQYSLFMFIFMVYFFMDVWYAYFNRYLQIIFRLETMFFFIFFHLYCYIVSTSSL